MYNGQGNQPIISLDMFSERYLKKTLHDFKNIFIFFSQILKFLKSNEYDTPPIVDAIKCLNRVHMSSYDDSQNFYDYIFFSLEIKEYLDFFIKSCDFNNEYLVSDYHDSEFFNKMVYLLKNSQIGSFVLLGKDRKYIYILYKSTDKRIDIIWIALKGNVRYGSNYI